MTEVVRISRVYQELLAWKVHPAVVDEVLSRKIPLDLTGESKTLTMAVVTEGWSPKMVYVYWLPDTETGYWKPDRVAG
jgi:hypothetical protein